MGPGKAPVEAARHWHHSAVPRRCAGPRRMARGGASGRPDARTRPGGRRRIMARTLRVMAGERRDNLNYRHRHLSSLLCTLRSDTPYLASGLGL